MIENVIATTITVKSKVRNRMGEIRTKKLITIMNFVDDVTIDLDRIVEIYKSLD